MLSQTPLPLLQVYETFGPVKKPYYQIRFNKEEDIAKHCDGAIVPGAEVFHAPGHPEYTRYIFLSQLYKLKGSDASWEHNNEPPAGVSLGWGRWWGREWVGGEVG